MSISVRMTSRLAIILHAVGCLVLVSGALAAAINIAEAAGMDIDNYLSCRALSLKVHGGAAMAMMILFGQILASHVPQAWASRRNRISGSIMLAAIGSLILTGYGLYYLSGELSRTAVRWIHLCLGLVEPFLLVSHIALGRRSRTV